MKTLISILFAASFVIAGYLHYTDTYCNKVEIESNETDVSQDEYNIPILNIGVDGELEMEYNNGIIKIN